jgi:hypothetical protein
LVVVVVERVPTRLKRARRAAVAAAAVYIKYRGTQFLILLQSLFKSAKVAWEELKEVNRMEGKASRAQPRHSDYSLPEVAVAVDLNQPVLHSMVYQVLRVVAVVAQAIIGWLTTQEPQELVPT